MKIRSFFILLAFSLHFFAFTANVFAANATPAPLIGSFLEKDVKKMIVTTKIEGEKILESSLIKKVIPKLFKLFFFLGGPLAVLAIIYGGFIMMTSFGESDKYYKGLKMLGLSIMGILIMLFSRAIVGIIESLSISGKKAGDKVKDLGESIKNLPSGELETEIIPHIITFAVEMISIVLVGIIVYAGTIYISPGLESQKENGKQLFFDAFIGLIIIIFAYGIVNAVLKFNILG